MVDIIFACKDGNSKTRASLTARLNPNNAKSFFDILEQEGLLRRDGNRYTPTTKGELFTHTFVVLEGYLEQRK